MDTINSQIILDNHVVHPETNAAQVIYGNTNAKAMMDGVLSSANLSSAVRQLLSSKNYSDACRALKVAPEIYFDECFNAWTPTGSPVVSDGAVTFTGAESLLCDTTFSLSNTDFCVQCDLTLGDSVSTTQAVYHIYASGGTPRRPGVQQCRRGRRPRGG